MGLTVTLPGTHWVLFKTIAQYSPTHFIQNVLDPTEDQFKPGKLPDYREMIPTGFLTKLPSKRAQKLMRKHAQV